MSGTFNVNEVAATSAFLHVLPLVVTSAVMFPLVPLSFTLLLFSLVFFDHLPLYLPIYLPIQPHTIHIHLLPLHFVNTVYNKSATMNSQGPQFIYQQPPPQQQ